MSVRAAPTLTVLTVPSLDAVDMDMELVQQHHHHQQQQQQQQTLLSPLSDGERSPKSRNALGLTLPGTRTSPTTFAHSIDAMLGDAKQEDMEMRKQHQQHHHHHSPPRRIIHEVSS
uniref:Secreted protein n=1 Tax=Globodera pallida TaxID=36090 RepID=A0A183CFB4_GLOPA